MLKTKPSWLVELTWESEEALMNITNDEEPVVEISGDADDMFVVFNGVKIAKRGHPDTQQAGSWISLEPGWTVRMTKNYATIEIEHNGVRVH